MYRQRQTLLLLLEPRDFFVSLSNQLALNAQLFFRLFQGFPRGFRLDLGGSRGSGRLFDFAAEPRLLLLLLVDQFSIEFDALRVLGFDGLLRLVSLC